MKRKIVILCSLLLTFTACVNEVETESSTDFTRSTYQQVILPIHATFNQKLNKLKSVVSIFANDLTIDNLNKVKTEWEVSYLSYTPTKVFNIDNIKDNYAHLYFQNFPVDTLKVIKLVNTNPNNAIVSSNAKGLAAIEYLIYRNAALDSFQNNANNTLYLQALSNDLVVKGEELNSMWKNNETKYFNNEESSAKNAFKQLVNGIIQFIENLKMVKVGEPLGKQALDHPNPYLSQAPFSNNSAAGIKADYEILYKLWTGNKSSNLKSSIGLGDLVKTKNTELYNQINVAFEQLKKDINALPMDLNTAFKIMDQSLNVVYTDLNNLYTLFKVDLSAQLDVTVFISDLDGD